MSWLFFFLAMAIFIYFLVRSAIAHQKPPVRPKELLDELDDDTEIIVEVQPVIRASMEVKHSPYPIDVIGESKYREELDSLCGRPERKVSKEFPARLIPADENPHEPLDRHPVRVEIKGTTVGYLDPEPALDYFERFGAIEMNCMANITGGGWVRNRKYRGNYGVRVTYDRHG